MDQARSRHRRQDAEGQRASITSQHGHAQTNSLWQRFQNAPMLRRFIDGVTYAAELGTSGYPPDIRRRLLIVNLIAYLIAVSTAIYALQHIQLDYETYKPLVFINLALLVIALLVPATHRFSPIAGGLVIVVSEYVALMAFTFYLGRTSGMQLQYLVAAAAPFVVFGLERIRLVIAIVAIGIALHLIAWFRFPSEAAHINAPSDVLDPLYVQAVITTVGLIAASVWYAFRLVERARGETDALLRNILPDSIADRLKARPGELIADSYSEATVLFADISGFVVIAHELGAARTVEMLNNLVSEFDALAARHGVEKIKTIGDAYMAVAGLPERTPDHTARMARMALDMLDATDRVRAETGLDLHMRIGMASGPVISGVIGTRKFSFDIWGDAVNLAARLEKLGANGLIHVCPACREKLEPGFTLEPRGAVDIKGVGQRETWFLVSAR